MKHLALFMLTAVVVVSACSDSTSSDDDTSVPPGDLRVLRLPPTAPELCSDSVSAVFTKRATGGPQEIALHFADEGCEDDEGKDFLRLRLERNSLMERPDGTPINVGDTVTITVKWVGSDSVLFEMRPAGLKFSPTALARLRIEYGECQGDFNNDGDDDDDDDQIENMLGIWRQEHLGEDFLRMTDVRIKDEDRIDADISGFTRFAIAY